MYLELYDTVPLMASSEVILPALEEQFPYPKRFHLVWQQEQGQRSLYAWEGIPPSDQFVCLGMIATTSETAPPVSRLRCVPRNYLMESADIPKCVWDDSGTGGTPGALWTGNSLNLFCVTKGHEPPIEPFFELKAPKFRLDILTEWKPKPKLEMAGGHKEGAPENHHWLSNNLRWCRNTKGWVSEMYKPTGANGPASNLVDGSLTSQWNAASADKEQWVIFDFGSPVELSAFKYHRLDSPEAPKECELRVRNGKGWTPVLQWIGIRGKGWSKDLEMVKTVHGSEFMLVVKNTFAENNFFGRLNRAQGVNIQQVLFHGHLPSGSPHKA